MRHCARAAVDAALGVLALCVFVPAFAEAAGKCGTVGNPGLSCADIFDAGGSVGDGVYSVRAPDGTVHSVYCDMQAGGYQLVAKIARGDSSVTDVESAWNDGSTHVGESDTKRLIASDASSGHYFSRFRHCWNDADCSVEVVSLQVMLGGESRKSIVFTGDGTTSTDFFSAGNVASSSWSDLKSSFPGNFFSIAGDAHRDFFINNIYGGCSVDAGWLVIVSGSYCNWEVVHGAYPVPLFSDEDTHTNVNGASFKPADTVAIYIKFSHPTTATQPACTTQGASMQLLTGGGAFNQESGQLADRTGSNYDGTGSARLSTQQAPWDPKDEVGVVRGSGFKWIDTPKNIQLQSTTARTFLDVVPPNVDVADRPTAIVANVHAFHSGDDWVSFALGREVSDAVFSTVTGDYGCKMDPVNKDGYWNDVVLTYHGQGDGWDNYGRSFGSVIIPLKDNFKFDINFAFGKKDSTTPEYLTIQVNGYFIGELAVPTDDVRGNNIIISHTVANYQDPTAYEALTALAPPVRSTARAVIASVYTYSVGRSSGTPDHYVHSFGRDNAHTNSAWSNSVYSNTNTRYNDLIITNEGDSSYDYTNGNWHGTQIIPLLEDQTFRIQLGMGKSNNDGTSHIVIQQYGYLNDVVAFLDAPANIQLHFTGRTKSNSISVPGAVPATATAIIASLTSYDSERGDHMVHSFGRNNNHDTHYWSNQPFNLDTYLNDVYVTHEGDTGGGYYYGHSFGTVIIPLRSDKTFSAMLGGGMNSATANAYVTLAVYGYINALGTGGTATPAVVVESGPAAGSFTASAFFHRRPEGISASFAVGSQCKAADASKCSWEIESSPAAVAVRARITFNGDATRANGDWDFVVATDPDLWHHVALVFDGDSRLATFYVDGVSHLAPLGTEGDAVSTAGMDIQYGKTGLGELHDLRFYDYTITPTTAAALWDGYRHMRQNVGMLLWWRLTEGSGAFIRDAARRGLTGSFIGSALWATNGMVGPFGTSNAYGILSAGNIGLAGDASFTLSAWVRPSATAAGRQHIMGTANGHIALALSGGRPAVDFAQGVMVRAASSVHTVEAGRWYHVAAVRAPGQKLATTWVYLDGSPVATELFEGVGVSGREGPATITDAQWVVGRSSSSSSPFTGEMYDARVYSIALDADALTGLWQHGLAAHWRLRDDVATLIPDHSPSGAFFTHTESSRSLGDEGLVRLSTTSSVVSRVPLAMDGDAELTLCAWAFYDSPEWGSGATISVVAALRAKTTTTQHGTMMAMGTRLGKGVVDFGDSIVLVANDLEIQTQAWFHMCATRTPGAKTVTTKLFVNGVPVALSPIEAGLDDRPPVFAADARLIVGAGGSNAQDGTRTLPGYIDDVKLYRRALSAGTIASLAASGRESHVRNLGLRCDGSGNHAQRLGGTHVGGAMTIEVRVLASDPVATGQGIVDVADSVASSRVTLSLEEGSGRMVYSVDNTNVGTGTTGAGELKTPTAFPTGLWVHVVVRHNEDGVAHIYWDGMLQTSGSVPVPTSKSREQLLVGRLMSKPLSVTFSGVIDDVAIWSDAHSPAEVLAASYTVKSATTVAWYNFEPSSVRSDPRMASEIDLLDTSVVDRSHAGGPATLVCEGVCLVSSPSGNAVCSDGVKQGAEACDDGNAVAGDGCSPTCAVEPGFVCLTDGVFEASVCDRGTMSRSQGFEALDAEASSLEWNFLAHNPGTDTTQVSYFDGGTFGGSTYANCHEYDHWGPNFIVRITMGRTEDFYRPDGHYTVCELLKMRAPNQKRRWSATALGNYINFPQYGHHFGGSQSGWAQDVDGRNYLSFWGDPSINGGCCHYLSDLNLAPGESIDVGNWGREFSIHVAQDVDTHDGEWLHVLTADGATAVQPGHYQSGVTTDSHVFSMACSEVNWFGSNFMFKVTMGNVVDYFVANSPTSTFCDVISSHTGHKYSPHEHGPFVTPQYYGNHLGGSSSGWPTSSDAASKGISNDGRSYTSFWGDISGSWPGGCCFMDSLEEGGSVPSGDWGLPFTVHVRRYKHKPFCNNVMDGGGWSLVRHQHPTSSWGPYNDGGLGSTAYREYQADPQHPYEAYSVKYSTAPFTKMMFATGDGSKYVIAARSEIARVAGSGPYTALRTHVHETGTSSVAWLNRNGLLEDPWLSARDHGYQGGAGSDGDVHSMVYGENSYPGWLHYLQNNLGANVFVDDTNVCPLGMWDATQPSRGEVSSLPAARALGKTGLRLRVEHTPFMTPSGRSNWAYATVLAATTTTDRTFIRLLGSVRESVGEESSPLVVTLQPDWVVPSFAAGPLACEPSSCNYHALRFCINPGPAVSALCDEVLHWDPHVWTPLRVHLVSRWQRKYPGEMPPMNVAVQVATYALEGTAEAWVDDVVGYDTAADAPPACPDIHAVSSPGHPDKIRSCWGWKSFDPNLPSGVYTINPTGNSAYQVYCVMDGHDGGGWITFQRRRSGSVSFERGWADYKNGFGQVSDSSGGDGSNLWLGNQKLHEFTSAFSSKSWFRLHSRAAGTSWEYRYNNFKVESESNSYTLRLTSGSPAHSQWDYHNDNAFNTYDSASPSCSNAYRGGWWYGGCHYMNYNGLWGNGAVSTYANYAVDHAQHGYYYAISNIDMMFKETTTSAYDYTDAELWVDGTNYATDAAGLQVVSAHGGAVTHQVFNLGDNGAAFLAFVEALPDGASVGGAVRGLISAGALAANWVTALEAVGIEAPIVTARMQWAFVGKVGSPVGTAQSRTARQEGYLAAEARTTFACPTLPSVAVPDNRANPAFHIAVRRDAPEGLRFGLERGPAANPVKVNSARQAVVPRYGTSLDASVVPSVDLVLHTYKPLLESAFLFASQAGAGSFKELTHGFGMSTANLRAVVRLRVRDGPNEGYVFGAVGSTMYGDAGAGRYGGAIVGVSSDKVRVWAPSSGTRDGGAIINIGVGWGLEEHAQRAAEADATVEVHTLGTATYDSDWFDMASQSGASSYKSLAHGLGGMPGRVRVLVKAESGANAGYVFEGWGAQQADDDVPGNYGGIVFGYDGTNVRLWAPMAANGHSRGYLVNVASGWAGTKNSQSTHSAKVRVMAWRGTRSPSYESGWLAMAVNAQTSFREFKHDLGVLPAYVQVLVKATGGPNAGYVFEGAPSCQIDVAQSLEYGGVVYAFNEEYVRVWAPSKDPASATNNGRIVSVWDGWGNNVNSGNEVAAEVKVLVWEADPFVASDRASLHIDLRSVNRGPQVRDSASLLSFGVGEGDMVTQVVATDPDGDDLTYEIVGGNTGAAFGIDQRTGRVVLLDMDAAYDREVFGLQVRVSDGTAYASGIVTIRTPNENRAPTIDSGMVVRVREGASAGTDVGARLNASDPDSGTRILFEIVGGDGADSFKVDVCTGQVRVKDGADLDYETKSSYTITVRVSDDAEPPLTAETDVTVQIIDSNDPPQCTHSMRVVSEHASSGDTVGSALAAFDAEGDNLSWRIADGNTLGALKMDPSGQLLVDIGTALDYETIPEFNITVVVTDDGEGALECVTSVTIRLEDKNDAPHLTSAVFFVDENSDDGTVVATLRPSDPDRWDAATVVMSGDSPHQDIFNLTNNRLRVHPGGSVALDHEVTPEFTLQFVVTDTGGPEGLGYEISTIVNVSVVVTDINDAPVLQLVTGVVSEDAEAGAVVLTAGGAAPVAFTDEDVDPADTVSFITGDHYAFRVDVDTGTVTLISSSILDFETQAEWTIDVTLVDDGSPPKSMDGVLTIQVSDANDDPIIECVDGLKGDLPRPGYSAVRGLLANNAQPGVDIFTFGPMASNAACSATCHNEVRCTAWTLHAASYYDTAVAGKCYGRAFGSDAMDIDHPDAYSGEVIALCQQASVDENTAEGSPVALTLQADDQDGDSVTFSIESGVDDNAFTVVGGNTLHVSSGGVDFERQSTYFIVVLAVDGNGGSATATVQVSVDDVDEPPVFAATSVDVTQGTLADVVVGTPLQGTDPEGEPVTYAFVSGQDGGGAFILDGASLKTTRLINDAEGSAFSLQVAATANGDSTTASVTVNVVQGNVAPAVADQARSVPENSAVGANVGVPLVVADDDGINGDGDSHTWAITGATPSEALALFTIDASTGQIKVSRADLDYERTAEYSLFVRVTDSVAGVDDAVVTVSVADVNELASCSSRVFSVEENTDTSSSVELEAAYSCVDPDGDTLSFTLDSAGVSGGRFAAVSTGTATASLAVAAGALLDYETEKVYDMDLTVDDGRGGVVTAAIKVLIVDVNEAPSVVHASLLHGLITARVPESESSVAGRTLVQLEHYDPDSDPVTWMIVSAVGGLAAPGADMNRNMTDVFDVDVALGAIRLQASAQLDFEDVEAYALTVVLSDGQLSNYVTVRIEVDDVNDVVISNVAPSGTGLTDEDGQWLVFTDGSEQATLTGTNLGPSPAKIAQLEAHCGGVEVTPLSVAATYGPYVPVCEVSVPNTAVTCQMQPGVGAGHAWAVSVGGTVASVSATTRYTPPKVTAARVASYSGPGSGQLQTPGGESIVITGESFGPAGTEAHAWYQSSGGLMFKAASCSVSVAQSELVCVSVAGVGHTFAWQVEVGGQRSDWFGTDMGYSAPEISAASVVGGGTLNTKGGVMVELQGANLGPAQVNVRVDVAGVREAISQPAPAVVATYRSTAVSGATFDASCTVVTDHSVVRCTTSAGAGAALQWVVVVNTQPSSAFASTVAYAGPTVTGVLGPGPYGGSTAGGDSLRVVGSSFGPVSVSAVDFVTYGPTGTELSAVQCRVTGNGVVDELSCVTSPGTGSGHRLQVSIGGQLSEVYHHEGYYAQPVVTGFTGEGAADARTDGGQAVLIHGSNFGFEDAKLGGITYTRQAPGGEPKVYEAAACAISVAHTEIACTTAPGAGTDLAWNVIIDGQPSVSPVTWYGKPAVSGLAWKATGRRLATPSGFIGTASTDGGQVVEIHGENFGTSDHIEGVTYGATGTEYKLSNVQVVSHSVIEGTTAAGIGSNLGFIIRVEGQASEHSTAKLSYSGPSITDIRICPPGTAKCHASNVVPTHNPDGSPTVVELRGYNFGLRDPGADAYVLLGNIGDSTRFGPLPLTYRYPTPSTDDYTPGSLHVVRFAVPSGIGGQRSLRLAVFPSGQPTFAVVSDPVTLHYASATLKYVEVTAANLTLSESYFPGQDVLRLVLHGFNFGTAASVNGDTVIRQVWIEEHDPAGNLAANFTASPDIVQVAEWSNPETGHNETTVYTPVRHGAAKMVVVAKNDDGDDVVQESSVATYADFSPRVSSLDSGTQQWNTAGGQVLTMQVAFMGSTQALWVTVGGNGTLCPLLFSDTEVPVTDDNRADYLEKFRTQFHDGGDTPGPTTLWTLKCRLPEGEGALVGVSVVRDGLPGAPYFIKYHNPTILTVAVQHPWEAGTSTTTVSDAAPGWVVRSATQGSAMTITGLNFGMCPVVSFGFEPVHFCGPNRQPGANRTHSSLFFEIPSGEGYGFDASVPYRMELDVAGQAPLSGFLNFAYLPPVVSSIFPSNGTTLGGDWVTITGRNFGVFDAATGEGAPTVTIGGRACSAVSQISHGELTCRTPAGTGVNRDVVVTAKLQSGSSPIFSYNPPIITSITSSAAASRVDGDGVLRGPTSGGFNVTIEGENFGSWEDTMFCVTVLWSKANQAPVCAGNSPATFLQHVGIVPQFMIHERDHHRIVFTMPEGMGRRDVGLVVNGQANVLRRVFMFNDPVITSLTPSAGSTIGGTVVTLHGQDLGSGALWPQLQYLRINVFGDCVSNATTSLGDIPSFASGCTGYGPSHLLSHTHSRVVFKSLPGIGVNRTVSVSIDDGGERVDSNAVMFHYHPPTVDAVFPNPAAMSETSMKLVIKGSNYGRDADSAAWTPEERVVVVLVDGVSCENARRVPGENGVLDCTVAPQLVGFKNVNITVAAQHGSLANSHPSALFMVCKVGYYGLPGEVCLPCPLGAACDGYDNGVHVEPRSIAGWYNLNGTLDDCVEARKSNYGITREHCNHVVPCEPKEACLGDNTCAAGYVSQAPMYRCSSCDSCYKAPGSTECQAYYRRAGECIECPDNPWILVGAFLVMAVCLCAGGYVLNQKNVNLAFVSIGVDYFQVLAMFANSKIKWPPAIKEMFHAFSVFNLNLEITAPECSIPDLGYTTKWFFIEALPLAAGSIFLVLHCMLWFKKRCILRRAKRKANTHVSQLVAMLLVMLYYLYLYITRTVLDVFNCSPTDPPDGHEYLEVIFERCWEAGGTQMTLLPFALLAMAVYVVGYPSTVFFLLHRDRVRIMEDQLLRAKGMGKTRLDNPHAYDVRKRLHKIYYHFRPDYWFWILCIIARKFFIAFTALMFNKNPAFQLSVALLVMFACYAMQVKHTPYMSPSEHSAVLADHETKAKVAGSIHNVLAGNLATVSNRMKKKARAVNQWGTAQRRKADQAARERASAFFFNYNTVEATLLASAVLVNLAGVMFESNRLSSDYYQEQRDIITYAVVVIIASSVSYFLVVFLSEVYITTCSKPSSTKRNPKGRSSQVPSALPTGDDHGPGVASEDSAATAGRAGGAVAGLNPMFLRMQEEEARQHAEAALPAVSRTDVDVAQLLAENQALKAEVERLKLGQSTHRRTRRDAPAADDARGRRPSDAGITKREFGQVRAGGEAGARRNGRSRRGGRGRSRPLSRARVRKPVSTD